MHSMLLFSALMVSSFSLELGAPDPYIGWGFGVNQSKLKGFDADNNIKKKNQQMFKLGLPFSFAHTELDRVGRMEIILLPEFAGHPEYIHAILAAGPEQEINLGPRHSPFLLVFGAQVGVYYGFLLKKKVGDEEFGANVSLLDRTSLAAVGNFYMGPHWGVLGGHSIGVMLNTQIMGGKIAAETIRTTKEDTIGWTAGLNLQVRFREIYD